MFTVIHGDDTTASRNYFHELKQNASAPNSLEGDKATITDITQILQGGGLFVDKQEVFLENLLSKKKDAKELQAILALFQSEGKTHDIVLWEGKELTKKQLDGVSGATVKVYKLPQSLFAFLESIRPGNSTQMVSLFHQTLTSSEPEMIFFMLIRQLRTLLALKDPQTTIDEVRRMSPWQRGKLQKQSQAFSDNQLISAYQKLAKLDLEHKTGGNVVPLTSSIDIFLMEV